MRLFFRPKIQFIYKSLRNDLGQLRHLLLFLSKAGKTENRNSFDIKNFYLSDFFVGNQ